MFIMYGAAFFTGCSSGSSSNNEILESLGVKTDLGKRTGPDKREVRDDYNPLNSDVTQIIRRCEIFAAGIAGEVDTVNNLAAWGAAEYHAALDCEFDSNAGTWTFTETQSSDSDTGWDKLPKSMAAGDVDGDGKDEVFIAYYNNSNSSLYFRVIGNTGGAYATTVNGTIATSVSVSEYPDHYWWLNNFNVAAGDADGNGQKEMLVAFNDTVYLIGDKSAGYRVLKSIKYDKGTYRYKLIKIAAGDLDNNGTDDFVVMDSSIATNHLTDFGYAQYRIYTGTNLTLMSSDSETNDSSGSIIVVEPGVGRIELYTASCAIGDVDADGLNEVLFVGKHIDTSCNQAYLAAILDPKDGKTGEMIFTFKPDYEYIACDNTAWLTPVCAIDDFDGDMKKEFLAYGYMYENYSEKSGFSRKKTGGTSTDLYVFAPTNAVNYQNAYECSYATGDVDGDGMAELVYFTDGYYAIYCTGYDTEGNWYKKNTLHNVINSEEFYPYLITGDFDGDSFTVKFIGYELLFSDPHPIAVLASNPYWSGMNTENGQTSFGTSTISEETKSKNGGISTGVSVGYEAEGLFGSYKAKASVSIEASLDWTASNSIAVSESYGYTTVNEDKVIFTCIPYDVYYYEIIQVPDSLKDKGILHTNMVINLPRKPITVPVERGYYNRNNGDAPDIDSTILTHTVGDPRSYPSSDDADNLLLQSDGTTGFNGAIKSSKTMTVGQGNGYDSIDLGQSSQRAYAVAFDLAVSIEAEAGAGGFTVCANAGFHYGEEYSISTTDEMTFGGQVGHINNDWSNWYYTWGLFAYRASLGNEKFIVVQYYVEE